MELTDMLRIAASVIGVIGSLLLAWRVSGILKALSLVANAHEANIQQLMNSSGTIYNFGNSTAHVEKAKGTGLLIAGFLCLAFSGCLNVVALIL
jgi:hypothetical protein